jgi:hypothetical protein
MTAQQTIPRGVRAGWEHRLPELPHPWTHWRLLGDGDHLADVPGEQLFEALRVVEANFGRFRSIKAARVAIDRSGQCLKEDPSLFEISNYAYDSQ